jgi:DNA-binding FadR family transcriptional regulator
MKPGQAAAPAAKPPRGANSLIARELGSRILHGEFPPGSLLPNESELSRTFDASRSVIRESTKILMAKGFLASRPKVGTRVEPRDHWNLLDREVLSWYSSPHNRRRLLQSVQQMRYIFEPEAAALAASHRTNAEMKAITAACKAMGSPELPLRIKADVEFHLGILKAAHNEFLIPFGFLIESGLMMVFETTTRKLGDLQYADKLHRNIEKAIRQRRSDAARRAVKRLLEHTNVTLFGTPTPAPKRKRR